MRTLSYERTCRHEVMCNVSSLVIGYTPHAEDDCAQIGHPNFTIENRLEIMALADQLRRLYGPEPDNAEFFIQSNDHDFGRYYELAIFYEEDREKWWDEEDACWKGEDAKSESYAYAGKCEDLPKLWDAEAKAWLKENGHSKFQTIKTN